MTRVPHRPTPHRRQVLQGAGFAGLTAIVAGCAPAVPATSLAQPAPASPAPATTAARPTRSAAPTAGTTLGPSSAVPVGGGTIYPAHQVVVTQPVMGVFRGFSAVCPHQGCLVSTVADGRIDCPCHGSKFSIMDGSLIAGPAPNGLPTVDVTQSGPDLVLHT